MTGPEIVFPAERASILGEVLDRPIELEAESDAEARARMSESMRPDMVDAFFQFFRGGGYDDARINDVAPRLLQRPLRTFRQWAHAHASFFS